MTETVTLHEHLIVRDAELEKRMLMLFEEREKQVAMALEAANRATEKAEAEALRAREAQNEWRATTTDLIGRFATLESVDVLRERVNQQGALSARLVGGLVVVALLLPVVAALAAKWID